MRQLGQFIEIQYNEAGNDMHRSVLVELALLLLFVTVAINIVARFLLWRVGRSGQIRRKPTVEPAPSATNSTVSRLPVRASTGPFRPAQLRAFCYEGEI